MRTPSLRKRVVVLGVVVVVVVLAGVDVLLYLTFRAQLLERLSAVLYERTEIVRVEARSRSGADLAARLTELGLGATVRSPDGTVYHAEPASPSLGAGLPSSPRGSLSGRMSRDVQLPDGSVVTVYARRAGTEDASRELLVLEAVGLITATLLAALLLLRASALALRPLREIADSARRTSRGQRGERLRPDQPSTALGRLATAYDEMLESLESSEKKANDAQMEIELLYLHLRQVIETANAGFVGMDASGVITDWNRKAEEIFGWSRSEIVGRAVVETLVPPALRAAHRAGLRRFLDTGEHRVLGSSVEFEALHRDGHLIPVEVAPWVTDFGDEVTFSAFLEDVSERRKGEEAMGRLASIVESAQEAIFSTSLDGTILTWNFGAERTYGYAAEEAIGKHVSLIVPPDRSDEIDRAREHVERGESVRRYETVRRRKDGSEVEVAVTVSPIFDPWGAVTGASTIGRDITEQRRMARALDETLTALQRALDEAQRSEERSRQFLADAAHQLRSPIAGIRACAETLLRGTQGVDSDRLLAELVRETSRVGRLITALLRLAQIDQGTQFESQPCDVAALCASEVERTRVLAPHLDVHLDVVGGPDRWPEFDSDTLTEVLSNLLDNARRHAATEIRVSVAVDDANLQVLVADDGSGVPEEAVDRIFDRFVSLDGEGGSGLGLPIARAMARGYGGDLTYRPDSRSGSTFGLILPLRARLPEDMWMRT